jgi:D-inositol-3-phosphate glycosyltransferase
VIDGETGFLVPCRDPMAIAERIRQLAGNRESARCLGRAGRQRFEREFSIAAHMRNMERVWVQALTRRPAGVP